MPRVAGDVAGVCLSLACMAHCLGMPWLVMAVPALDVWPWSSREVHRVAVVLVLGVACASLTPGYLRHKRWSVLVPAAVGVAGMIALAYAPREFRPPRFEQGAMLALSLLVIASHAANAWSLRRHARRSGEREASFQLVATPQLDHAVASATGEKAGVSDIGQRGDARRVPA